MFTFKRFTINQRPDAGMKVGTDGVLLGAWARVDPSMGRLLDAGTGTGVIALMLAQRTAARGAHIDALDIDRNSYLQAAENAQASPWSDRIRVIHSSLQSHAARRPHASRSALREWASRPATYDHIVSNPPFFRDAPLRPRSAAKAIARHAITLPPQELVEAVDRLLAPRGVFSVILPVEEAKELRAHAVARDLLLSRQTMVATRPGAAPKRVLMEFSRGGAAPATDMLVVGDERYAALTGEFYLPR